MAAVSIRERLAEVDWQACEASLRDRGWALTGPVLRAPECTALIAMYDDDARFRSRVQMERMRFGVGDYAYFSRPLPTVVQQLRTAAYRHLFPIANRWTEDLGTRARYPPTLSGFLRQCAAAGQTRPTPLLLRYEAGGYNCLHRDLYGTMAFPLQMTCFLSRSEFDYGGGEFLLLEQRPRCQARGEVIRPDRGDLLIFPVAWRPVSGRRGVLRTAVRHGVSRVTHGHRYALGIIFHDAR